MCMTHLNSQIHQYGGFTTGNRVSVEPRNYRFVRFLTRTLTTHYIQMMPMRQKKKALVKFRGIQKRLRKAIPNDNSIWLYAPLFENWKAIYSYYGELFPRIETSKLDNKWSGPGIIIGRFGIKFAFVYIRRNTVEVELNETRRTDKISDVLGYGGTWRLRLSNTKSPLHYSVDRQHIDCLSKIRNAISNQIATTWGNTDTTIRSDDFYKHKMKKEIATHESVGCDGFKHFLEYLTDMSLGGLRTNISELQDLERMGARRSKICAASRPNFEVPNV